MKNNPLNRTMFTLAFMAMLLLPTMGSAQPPGYSFCSSDGGTCSFVGANGALDIAYGANGRFVFRNFPNGSIPCIYDIFDGDPLPGVPKSCYIPTDPPGYTFCTQENGTCNLTTTTTVAFGANGHYVFDNMSGSFRCDGNHFYPDPIWGVPKACFIPAAPPDYISCSNENQECIFEAVVGGVENVAFGANGNFDFQNFGTPGAYTSVWCGGSTFWNWDPAPYVVKSCLTANRTVTLAPLDQPFGYSLCSKENFRCNFYGPLRVVYGANGNFISKIFTSNGIDCSNSTFSNATFDGDVAPYVPKGCYIPTDPPGYGLCSAEGGTCDFSGTATVAYGANRNFIFMSATNGTPCTTAAFGGVDPAPNVGNKSCYIPQGPPGYSYCSSQGGICSPPNGQPYAYYAYIYYGFDGAFNYHENAGSFQCNNGTLGPDPLPNIAKACFVIWGVPFQ